MEEEKKNPDDITFKGPGAFDRAKFNSDVTDRLVTREQVDEKKSVDDVIKEARKYYSKSYKEELKKIDSAYPDDNFYEYASNTSNEDINEIVKKIDSGEAITSKEIDKMAVNSANKASESVKALKSTEALKVIESIGVNEIEMMDGFSDAFLKLDDLLSNTEYTYDKLIQTFNNYLENREEPKGKEILELNAIVSMLSSVLNSSGFKSPSIQKEAEDSDKDIQLLISGEQGSVEGNKEVEKIKEETPEGVIKTEENKLADTSRTEKKTDLSAEDALLVSKSGSSVTEEPKNNIEEQKLESVVEKKEIEKEPQINEKSEVLSTEQKITEEDKRIETADNQVEINKTETQLVEKSENNESPIKDIFKGTIFEGLIGTINPTENKNPESGKEVKLENSTEALAKVSEIKEETKSLEGNKTEDKQENKITPLSNPTSTKIENKLEEVKPTLAKVEGSVEELKKLDVTELDTTKISPVEIKQGMNLEIEKPLAKPEEKGKNKIGSVISKFVEKIKDKNETIPEDKGIKLTESQKLSVKTPEVKKEEIKEINQTPEKNPEIVKETVNSGEEKTETSDSVKNTAIKEKEAGVVVDTKSLEEKMDHMISLLSMLNDTLQGPLLVSTNNKNFE